MAFAFRLERVLDLRKREVEQCEKELAKRIEQVREAQAVVQHLRAERAALNTAWGDAMKGAMDRTLLQTFHGCAVAFETGITIALAEVERRQKEELACRALLGKAMTRKKVLDRLRARAFKRFNDDANKRLQNQLDDFSVMRHGQERLAQAHEWPELEGLEA